jgi:HIRAN domain-containing protein
MTTPEGTNEGNPPAGKRRTSITKLQRETAAAAELISLCQTVTEDGHLADEEIAGLRQWLLDHRGSDLPAIAFLLETVDRILADGRVTPDERGDLYRAIETVLPPDIRQSVRGTRTSAEKLAKETTRQRKAITRELARQEQDRALPVESWDFMVAGCRYEGRGMVIRQHCEPNDVAYLIRDRTNRYSRNAVEVRLSNGMQCGFVPEEHALDMAPFLDSGHRHRAYVKKILGAGRAPIPVIVADLFLPETPVRDAIAERDVPAKQFPLVTCGAEGPEPGAAIPPQPQSRGCLIPIVLIGAAALGSLFR